MILISLDFYFHISPHSREKYSTVYRIFNSVLDGWKCGQAHSFVFEIGRSRPLLLGISTAHAIH